MSRRGASMPNLCVVAMVSFCTAVLITRGFSRGEAARQKGSSSKERELLSELDAIEAECQKETKEMKKKLKECKKEVKKMTQMAEDEQENYEENGEKKETLPYLSIAIPTVPRQGSKYLRDTLKSIEKQVTGTWEGNLVTYVMNMKKGEHDEFTSLKDKYRKARWVVFLDSPEKYEDNPDDPVPQVKPMRRQERPTKRVRRQTLDVARLLEHVSGRSQYTMLYEDDFHLCENGLMAIQYMIEKANRYQEGWAGIRCSFGLAGIMLHNKGEYNDVEQFARYLKKHYARRPPDHLVVEWYAGEIEESKEYFGDRRVMAFRHNIAHHIGEHSSIRETKHWSFPGCFAELIAPQVFPVEAWSPVDCPNDDLWPCTSATGPSKLAWTTDSHDRVQPGTKATENMSWLQVVLLTVLLYMVRSGDAQCSVVVVNNVKKFFLIDCASIETALAGGSLSVAEWKVMCNNCVPQVEPMKATLFLGCDNEAAKFEEVKLSCGTSCKTTDAPETTVPSTSAPCPVCPETPVPTVATTPSPVTPEDSSGSGTSSVSLSGPIATVFIVGVCLIVCIAASSIWYQYIRKSPEEKAQDEKLRNFNILEVQPRYANANALQSPTIAPSYAHSEPEGMSAFDGRSVHSGYHNVGNDSRVLSVA